MWVDERNEFCDAESVIKAASTAWVNIGETIDIGDYTVTDIDAMPPTTTALLRDVGSGEPIYLVITVQETIDAAGTGDITFRLVSDAADPPNVSTATVHWTSAVIATAATPPAGLTAGAVIAKVALPLEATYEQVLGIQYRVQTQATTGTGAIDAFLTQQPNAYFAANDATN